MSGMSKLDYLKRYMDGSDSKSSIKKKKKKIKKSTKNNIKIVDSDIGFIDAKVNSDVEDDSYALQEEKPLLYALDGATVITKEFHEQEELKKNRWAPIKNDSQKGKVIKQSRHDSSDSDMSPNRESGQPNKRVVSALKRHDSSDSSDLSPERYGSKSNIAPKRKRHDSSESDLSPERGRRTNKSEQLRRKRHDSDDSDLSPKRGGSPDSDMSPPRKEKAVDKADLSPVRQKDRGSRTNVKHETEVPEILSTGKKSGLQTSAQLREENEKKRKMELQYLNDMDESVSGKGAETVHRDRKTGKKVDIKFEELKKKKELEVKLQENEKHARWGKGIAQVDDREQKLQDDLHEMEKPLARYKDDADLDKLLKKQDREGDPMLAYLMKRKEKKINTPSKPKYRGPPPPPNRFNIMPGYRYDGVDRSNGFEKKRFMAINKKKSFETDKYKWSVEDM